jgi:radical SAM superfamily enzyme YgiQ (UPF0313 family)
MELPQRPEGDILLKPGELTDIRRRLRIVASQHDLTTIVASAFDHRTRVLPFVFSDLRMAPAGARAIGGAMVDSGFDKTRVVLQQWNKNFRPSIMKLDGRTPDLFMVSSMHLHAAECDRLIADACQIEPSKRPLIIAGGPRMIYEPWSAFSTNSDQPWGADVAVTGEEYVLLQMLEVVLSFRTDGEPMRSAFARARDAGALDEIPGLVYSRTSIPGGPAEELVDTGIQRFVPDLDELPPLPLGYRILEPPSKGETLSSAALPSNQIRKFAFASALILTTGCKFHCSFCPIPAYNQRQNRSKSGDRIADEMEQLVTEFNINTFFGTDDNFFNDHERTMNIVETLARRVGAGKRPLCKVRWGTEATIHDTIKLKEHLPEIRKTGLVALWLGVEDITASLVSKGQSGDKTLEAFKLLRENGIFPMPMMMHHDTQPLVSFKSNYGLINQLRILRKAGALNAQVLMLTPSPGSKWYEETYSSGLVMKNVGGKPVELYHIDGNYVVATKKRRPWIRQLYLLSGYAYFFNPLRFLLSLIVSKSHILLNDAETRPTEEVEKYSRVKKMRRKVYLKTRSHLFDAGMQIFGMAGLIPTARRTLGWAWRLFGAKVERHDTPPLSKIPMRNPQGERAAHALPGALVSIQTSNLDGKKQSAESSGKNTQSDNRSDDSDCSRAA